MKSKLDLEDIQQRVTSDFVEKSIEANAILKEAIIRTDYLDHPRILRCILFLSNGDIESLKKHIDIAIFDPRDVMFNAEYTDRESGKPKRIRNFNKSF